MRCAPFVLFAMSTVVAPAQVFSTLANFDGTNGALPFGPLTQGADGKLYGTATSGGANEQGLIYKIVGSKLTTLYSFCVLTECTDGAQPWAGLVLSQGGQFIGTTGTGGIDGFGTVFKITPEGRLTTLHSFNGTDGAMPFEGLVMRNDGTFYGTTSFGDVPGCNLGNYTGCGTVFTITAQGELTTSYSFCSQTGCVDGAMPYASLVQATNGNFYGTTLEGGTFNFGTVFKISPRGNLITLHSFDGTDGAEPEGPLVEATDGNFYGVTVEAEDRNCNCGSIFRMTPSGTLTTFHEFEGTDGSEPAEGLIQGTDGNLYGTTAYGGDLTCNSPYGCGTLFKIALDGTLTTLHTFEQSDGSSPYGITQATDGIFYGVTFFGGITTNYCTGGCGTVFSLDMDFSPFVAFVRAAGKIGQTGGILGQGFNGTTSVAINGIAASFTVVSDTFIKATVPAGATTGYVTVTTPSGTLTSNVKFHVIK